MVHIAQLTMKFGGVAGAEHAKARRCKFRFKIPTVRLSGLVQNKIKSHCIKSIYVSTATANWIGRGLISCVHVKMKFYRA